VRTWRTSGLGQGEQGSCIWVLLSQERNSRALDVMNDTLGDEQVDFGFPRTVFEHSRPEPSGWDGWALACRSVVIDVGL